MLAWRNVCSAMLLVATMPGAARADGGALILTERHGDLVISLFASPATLRCGLVDFSVYIQPPKAVQTVTVFAMHEANPAVRVGGVATASAATIKLFLAIPIELPQPGRWRIEVTAGDLDPIFATIEVGPGPPPWLDLVAWIGWPAIAIVLFAVHRRLVTRSQTCRSRASARTL